MAKSTADWVLPGGKPGELGYCTRCGQGLNINLPQPMEIALACMNAFVKMHSRCAPGKYIEKPPQSPVQWAMGRDVGISSATIYAAITGEPSPCSYFDIPYDPDDFGRCYRLLNLFPTWRPLLNKTIKLCAQWEPFVDAWDELTAMFESAGWHNEQNKAKGDGGKMYKRMNELRELAKSKQMVGRAPSQSSISGDEL